MSLGENSLVAAYQGKGKRTVDHQRARVVTLTLTQKFDLDSKFDPEFDLGPEFDLDPD